MSRGLCQALPGYDIQIFYFAQLRQLPPALLLGKFDPFMKFRHCLIGGMPKLPDFLAGDVTATNQLGEIVAVIAKRPCQLRYRSQIFVFFAAHGSFFDFCFEIVPYYAQT